MNLLLHCFDESSCSLDILCDALRKQASGNISIMNSFYSKSVYDTCRKNNIDVNQWGSEFHTYRQHDNIEVDGVKRSLSADQLDSLDLLLLNRMFLRTIYFKDGPGIFDFYLNKLIGRFEGLLLAKNIQVIVVYVFPHSFADYVLVAVAKAMKIPVIGVSPFADQHNGLLAFYDYQDHKYIKPLHTLITNHRKAITDQLSNKFLEGYKKKDKKSLPYSKEYIDDFKNEIQQAKKIISKNYCCDEVLEILNIVASCKRRIQEKSVSLIEQHEYKLVCYLAFEPEANLAPAGARNYDQLIFIDRLNKLALEFNLKLYIKEHPYQIKLPTENPFNLPQFSKAQFQKQDSYYNIIENMKSFAGYIDPKLKNIQYDSYNIICGLNGSALIEAAIEDQIVITGSSTPLEGNVNCITFSDITQKESVSSALDLLIKNRKKKMFDADLFKNFFCGSENFRKEKISRQGSIEYAEIIWIGIRTILEGHGIKAESTDSAHPRVAAQ